MKNKLNELIIWDRMKHPAFWLGVILSIFAITGVSPLSLTTFGALFAMLKVLFTNPVLIATFLAQVYFVGLNPNSKGFTDKYEIIEREVMKENAITERLEDNE